ncbi:MAG TPA: hypothetical protein VES42_21715, partial [Pilimelia sp.]|nr:hypothetical protein [Pilimelia sp.]
IAVHESTLRPAQIVDVRGLPCLPPARCAVDLARALPRPDALAVLDGALRARRCTPADLASELVAHGRLRGVRQARGLIGLATGLAGCRQESHLRLLLHDAGLPAPAPQLGVADERGLVRYRIALAYEEERVGVEYDGAPRPGRAPADRHRHNWLATRGWQLHHVTDADLYHSPQGLVATVRAGLRAARPAR